MNKFKSLHTILELSEFVKIETHNDIKHHPLKNDMNKSSRRILFILSTYGPMNQRALSRKLLVSPQAISESIKKLENDNIITKDILKNETVIKLTLEGESEAKLFKDVLQRHADRLFEGFTDEELDTYIKFANKLMKKENDNV